MLPPNVFFTVSQVLIRKGYQHLLLRKVYHSRLLYASRAEIDASQMETRDVPRVPSHTCLASFWTPHQSWDAEM